MIKPEYAWNRVYCFIMKIKEDYLHAFPGDKNPYDKGEFDSVIHRWVDALQNSNYTKIVKYLQINHWGNLCLVKYKPYTAIFGDFEFDEFWEVEDQFYRYCRGVTVDVEKDELVLCGFDKFFNIDELPETSTDEVIKKVAAAKVVEITNKLDGSIQMARYYDSKIILSGSTAVSPEVSYRVVNGLNFIEEHDNYSRMLKENPALCFIFESLTADDPHVVSYDYNKMQGLWLIGARDMVTGEVLHYSELSKLAKEYGVNITAYEVMTIDELLSSRSLFKCDVKEGWVLNLDGWRVKVKCDDFLTFHTMLSGVKKDDNRLGNNILDAMRMDRLDDFLSMIPESYKDKVDRVLDVIRGYIRFYETNAEEYFRKGMEATKDSDDGDAKPFMLWVDKNVPKQFKAVTRNKYRGVSTNYFKGKNYQDYLDDKEKNGW